MKGKKVNIPLGDVNDTEAVLVEWFVKESQAVMPTDIICEIETTKAVVEIEAGEKGYIYPLVKEGEKVQINAVLAWVLPKKDSSFIEKHSELKSKDSGPIITKKANQRMKQLGISRNNFEGYSMIRVSDVEKLVLDSKNKMRTDDDIIALINKISINDASVIIYGAGNHGTVVHDCLEVGKQFNPVAFIDDSAINVKLGLPVFSTKWLPLLKKEGVINAHVSISNFLGQDHAVNILTNEGFEIIQAIHPSSIISKSANIGKGVYIGPGAIVGNEVIIGDFVHICNGASIAHHCQIGRNARITDGARLAGSITVGEGFYGGLGVTINKEISIGNNVTIVSGVSVYAHVSSDQVIRADGKCYPKKI